MNLTQAFARNVRTCRPDGKGEAQVADPQEREYRGRARGRNIP
ncbi:hypothetical protein ACFSKU_18365 [Pontibacter silvestris]|uniref:Uncharacterized protein n=1 Tax=Pontibacter silvestris TaxID=2305183 RepID=A0ABW4X2N1_9BACT|nr:hypothetical protein [Pontibacter silvestris]